MTSFVNFCILSIIIQKKPFKAQQNCLKFTIFLELIRERYKSAYLSSQDIVIDESLTLWRGNLGFSRYHRKPLNLALKPMNYVNRQQDIYGTSLSITENKQIILQLYNAHTNVNQHK